MKKMLVFCFFVLLSLPGISQSTPTISIIPEPVILTKKTGSFELKDKLLVSSPATAEMKQVLTTLGKISTASGIPITNTNDAGAATVNLLLNKTANARIGNEGYQL